MIIYSIEICMQKDSCQDWLDWMNHTHIPDIMKTNLFTKFKFYKNLSSKNNHTYTIQYETNSITNYLIYQKNFADDFKKDHINKFKNKFTAERGLFLKLNDLD